MIRTISACQADRSIIVQEQSVKHEGVKTNRLLVEKQVKYLHHLLKHFDPLTALWRFPFEHVAVVRFGRSGKLGERRTAHIIWKYNEEYISSADHNILLL